MEKYFKIFGLTVASWGEKSSQAINITRKAPENNTRKALPAGRTSIAPGSNSFIPTENGFEIMLPDYYLALIPYIRSLVSTNQNMSQALSNIVELGNTGHSIKFDASVSAEQIVKMQQHIEARRKNWAVSKPNVDGIVDRMFRQIMVSGALSVEWIPKNDLTGIKRIAMVNPETIRWGYDGKKDEYQPFQTVEGKVVNSSTNNLITLNTNTYQYYAINGDTDIPYGIPPYLSALGPLNTQKKMMDNINFLIEQVGLAGFLEMLMEKPEREGDEAWDKYYARLDKFLDDAKARVTLGFRDGVSVGYKEDTEFKFHATAKSFGGVNEFFILNELLFGSGLNMDMSMMGRNYGSSEAQITIVFTKLLSQLNTIQQLVAACLEYGYTLELRLAGFQFKTLNVQFNPSTALDELKYQQAEEIRIRNYNQLYADGIISQEQYAQGVGYEKPNKKQPRYVPTTRETPQDAAARRAAENRKKDEGDKKSRRKKKDQDIKDK